MRWPFSKKHSELTLPPEDAQRWSVASGDYGGGPLVVQTSQDIPRSRSSSASPSR